MSWVCVNTMNMFILLLLVYNYGLVFSIAAADDAANLTSLTDKRVEAGFISIDCGMIGKSRYDNDRGLYYKSDSEFINTGRNMNVTGGSWKSFDTLRSFPDGIRNCYTLKPLHGKNRYYLIRAMFKYGNYDGKNTIPVFDIYIGDHFWTRVNLLSVEDENIIDLIYAPPEDLIHVCLVKIGPTTPFISTIELKPLNGSIYNSSECALIKRQRSDVGMNSIGYVSTIDDPYDRLWEPFNDDDQAWGSLKTDQLSTNSTFTDPYEVPPSVLKTAGIPKRSTTPLKHYWSKGSSNSGLVRIYWHFAEIQKLATDESREFTISIPGKYHSGTINLRYLQPLTVVSPVIPLINGSAIEFSIVKTNRSKLPPILNAFEIYEIVYMN